MIIDAHFHTNVYERYEGAIRTALHILQKSKILVVSNTCSVPEYKTTIKIAKKSPLILPTFGVHPQMAPEYIENLSSLQKYLDEALIYGEIGLDHVHITNKAQYPIQEKLLRLFFENAKKQNKLVILHLDGAEEKGLEIVKEYSLEKVVVHGYWGSEETAKKMIEAGIFFSVGGNMINEKFKSLIRDDDWIRVQNIIKIIPDELLLVETDGPSRTDPDTLPDAPRCMPNYIIESMKRVSKIRQTKFEELKQLTVKNFLGLIEDDYRFETFISLIKTHL